jgi:hypothetical protein
VTVVGHSLVEAVTGAARKKSQEIPFRGAGYPTENAGIRETPRSRKDKQATRGTNRSGRNAQYQQNGQTNTSGALEFEKSVTGAKPA